MSITSSMHQPQLRQRIQRKERAVVRRLLGATCLMVMSATAGAADLAATLASQGQFKQLLDAARAAGLAAIMSQPGPYTVFAPTDAAFKALPPERIAALMKPENKAELVNLLSYHMVIGQIDAEAWRGRKVAVKSANGMSLTIEGEQGKAKVNEAQATQVDIKADNGVIHVIDHVLMPPTPIAPKT